MPYSCSMATDKYTSFADLRGSEPKASFAIDVEARPESHVIAIAPHGGKIEVLTSEIARRIAGSDFSYYSFTGAKPDHNRDLHITSHRFDEPMAVALVARHQWVVSIHGCRGDMSHWVYVVGPLTGAAIAVGFAFVLRGYGGGRSGSAAAQGALDTEVRRPPQP